MEISEAEIKSCVLEAIRQHRHLNPDMPIPSKWETEIIASDPDGEYSIIVILHGWSKYRKPYAEVIRPGGRWEVNLNGTHSRNIGKVYKCREIES